MIVAVGTGGTISGIGRYLKEQNPNIRMIGVEPRHSIFEYYVKYGEMPTDNLGKHDGIEGIGRTFLPGAFDAKVVDRVFQVTEKDAREAALWYKKEQGSLLGFSSAAVVSALQQFASEMELTPDSRIGILFPDHGGRYISKLYGKN